MASGACPVVLLTSHTDPAVAARAIDAGVLGFLVKPLRAEELGPALDVAVSRFREMAAMRQENETLKRTLETRKLVERAKGILMKRLGLSRAGGLPADPEDGHGHAPADDGGRPGPAPHRGDGAGAARASSRAARAADFFGTLVPLPHRWAVGHPTDRS